MKKLLTMMFVSIPTVSFAGNLVGGLTSAFGSETINKALEAGQWIFTLIWISKNFHLFMFMVCLATSIYCIKTVNEMLIEFDKNDKNKATETTGYSKFKYWMGFSVRAFPILAFTTIGIFSFYICFQIVIELQTLNNFAETIKSSV